MWVASCTTDAMRESWMTTTLLETDERDLRSAATGSLRLLEEASKEGKRCEGNFDSAFGLGAGETKGGVLKSWIWMLEMEFGSKPWARAMVWWLCVAVPTKWTG